MPTLTINGNIRTNTTAGWAADATVYTAKTILVTTDATYGATDQRKFKIADGTQTWSNLDYFPVSGYDDATSSIQNQLNAKLTSANIVETITNGVTTNAPSENAVFDALALKKTIATGNAYKFETTDATGNLQETTVTASRAVATDANGLPTASATTATELAYLSGVTSAIQTQLNAKLGIVISFFPANQFNPNDGATYYFGTHIASTVQSSAGFGDSIAPVAFTIRSIYAISFQGAGSNENVTYEIGVNGSYTTISSTVQLTATSVEFSATGLSIAVAAGDNLTIRMTSPTWVTNPTNMRAGFNLYGN